MSMLEAMVEWVFWAGTAYVLAGMGFAIGFVLRGAGRLDENAAHGNRWFRVVIFPASLAMWPWLLVWWRAASRAAGVRIPDAVGPFPPRAQAQVHGMVWLVVAGLGLAGFAAALGGRGLHRVERTGSVAGLGLAISEPIEVGDGWPVRISVHGGPTERQAVIDCQFDNGQPSTAIYWRLTGADDETDAVGRVVFLGAVRGVTTRVVGLPGPGGSLTLVSQDAEGSRQTTVALPE